MDSQKRRDPRTPPQRPRANIRNTHNHDTASVISFIVEAAGAAVLGAFLAWFTLEWADRSYHLAEMAAQYCVAEVSHE